MCLIIEQFVQRTRNTNYKQTTPIFPVSCLPSPLFKSLRLRPKLKLTLSSQMAHCSAHSTVVADRHRPLHP